MYNLSLQVGIFIEKAILPKKDLGNVPKLQPLIFRTSSRTGVRLQALQMSEAVQKIETKDTDQEISEQYFNYNRAW